MLTKLVYCEQTVSAVDVINNFTKENRGILFCIMKLL